MRTTQIQESSRIFPRRDWSSQILSLIVVALFFVFPFQRTLAGDITVTATLQPPVTVVGEPVQLAVSVKGSQKVRQPPVVNVDGAQVQYLGPSLQTTLNNSEMTITMTHRYYVTPQKTGDLTVPAIDVEIDGQHYTTQPAILRVVDAGQGNAPEVNQGALVEVQGPNRPVYVGESFPVEVRLLVPSEVRWRIEAMPDFEANAFVKTQFQQPQQRQEVRNGRAYDMLVFRSVLTAIKSGNVELGTISFRLQMAAPKKRERQNSPFGGIFDGFPFDTQPTVLQERTLIYKDARMQVMELPTEGKPESFRGAVGRFRFAANSNQPKIKVGEPLTMNLQVEGEGSFDRIEVPPMVKPEGWRIYPPEINFVKADDSGMRGMKTFRTAVVPEVAHSQTPQFEFSFFDPETAKYSVIRSNSAPLQVEGSLPVAAKPETVVVSAPPPKPVEAKPPSPVLEVNTVVQTERPVWKATPLFWAIQGVVGLILALWAVVRVLAGRREKAGVAPLLRKEAASLFSRLKGKNEAGEFMSDAIRIIQLKVSAETGQPVGAIGAAEAASALRMSGDAVAELKWLFDLDAEARFAGGADTVQLKAEDRARILTLLGRVF